MRNAKAESGTEGGEKMTKCVLCWAGRDAEARVQLLSRAGRWSKVCLVAQRDGTANTIYHDRTVCCKNIFHKGAGRHTFYQVHDGTGW